MHAHPGSGIRNPSMRLPYYTAGSQKRLHGTGGGFLRAVRQFRSSRGKSLARYKLVQTHFRVRPFT